MVKSCLVKSIHLVHWNCTTSKCGKKKRTWLAPVPQAPILLRPGAKRHPTEKGRIHRGGTTESQRFSRAKNMKIWSTKMGGSKFCRNGSLFHQKLGFAICVRRRLNIKLCEMVHPQLHEDITRYGTHYCRWKSGRQNWIQPSKIRWKLTRFWATRGPKIWKSIGRIISSVW